MHFLEIFCLQKHYINKKNSDYDFGAVRDLVDSVLSQACHYLNTSECNESDGHCKIANVQLDRLVLAEP